MYNVTIWQTYPLWNNDHNQVISTSINSQLPFCVCVVLLSLQITRMQKHSVIKYSQQAVH